MNAADRRTAELLEDVASRVEFPETPPLASMVRHRIESGPRPVATIRLPRTRPPRWRPVAVTASVVVLALVVTLTLSVTARRAVADLLGVVGIHITFDDEAAPALPRSRPDLRLGQQMNKGEASERVGFDVLTPSAPLSRRVWAVYYEPLVGERGMVSLVYPATASSVSEMDLLVTQFAATLDEGFVKKLALEGADVRHVQVRSTGGFWVGGDPHLFWYVDSDGEPRTETIRLAEKTLLWEEGGITYRIEGADSLKAALRIARSMR